MNSDFRDLLRIFNAAKVRYLVVGGHAVMKYTEPRTPRTWTSGSKRRPRTLGQCSRHSRNSEPRSRISPRSTSPRKDTSTRWDALRAGRYRDVDCGSPLRRCLASPSRNDFDGVPAQVIGLKHLIANKQAVGRPQDLMDVTNLLESEQVSERPPPGLETPKKKRPKGRDA